MQNFAPGHRAPLKVLVLGRSGQLAQELACTCPSQFDMHCWGRADIELSDLESTQKKIAGLQPHVIVNAAAYTAVDRAETDADGAYLLNVVAVELLATIAKTHAIPLIHISTDFVFDGEQNRPYAPSSPTSPLGVYGESKRQGELAIERIAPPQVVIVRTAWLYSVYGANFVKTMLRLMTERPMLSVVADHIGTPTHAKSLAVALWKVVDTLIEERRALAPRGVEIHHWTDAGVASWYDFAAAIYREADALRLLPGEVLVNPISAEQYPTAAKRPSFSVLEKISFINRFQIAPRHWQLELSSMLKSLAAAANESEVRG